MKNEAHYEYPVNLYISKSYDDAETAQNFIKSLAGEQLTVSKSRNGDYLYVSIEGSDEDIDAFLDVYKDTFTDIVWDCDADANGWVKPKDVYDSIGQDGKVLPEESKVGEGRSNEDYLQEVWDSLAVAWDKDKFNMGKGYDSEYECECITITSKDNEEVHAKIYVEDYNGKHPAAFNVVYRYPGDKGVGVMGSYEFQSTDMDGLGEEVFDYFDEIKQKVGESMKNENGDKADVYTIDLTRISSDGYEEGIDDMQAAQIFYDEADAIKTAKELADSYKNDDDVVQVTVLAGQYETPRGIFGEPFDIFTASSSNSMTTAEYRKKANYVKTTGLDYYANGGKSEGNDDGKGCKDKDCKDDESKKSMGRDQFIKDVLELADAEKQKYYQDELVSFARGYYDRGETSVDKVLSDYFADINESKKSESDETSWALEYLVETAKEKGLKVSWEGSNEICITIGTFPHQDHIFVTDDAPGKDDTSLELYVPAAHINTSGLTLQDVLDYLDDPIGKRDAVQFKNGNRSGKVEAKKSEGLPPKKLGSNRQYRSRADLINKMKALGAVEITTPAQFNDIHSKQWLHTAGYAMDINGNLIGQTYFGDKDGKWYYATTKTFQGDYLPECKEEAKKSESSRSITPEKIEALLDEKGLVFRKEGTPTSPTYTVYDSIETKELAEQTHHKVGNMFYIAMTSLGGASISVLCLGGDYYSNNFVKRGIATMGALRKYVDLIMSWFKSPNNDDRVSESLTLKQKELKDMARYGEAEDITTISDAEAKELKKKGIETVGISRGVYGMNGALLRDNEGNKYVITARSSNLFYFV